MKNTYKILLSLGSNLGNREDFLDKAINLLKTSVFIENSEVKVSKFYETEPVGEKNQDYFLNIAISGFTQLNESELLTICKNIESEIGRTQRGKWKEREIDIDIILFDKFNYKSRKLNIPHPQMHLRKFVLIPCAEIEPDMIHPNLNFSIYELLEKCEDESSIIFYKKESVLI